MEIAHRVRMGEDRDAVQEKLELEPSSDFDDDEESEEVELDDSVFVIRPHDTAASRIMKDPGASSNAPKARKRAADGARRRRRRRSGPEWCSRKGMLYQRRVRRWQAWPTRRMVKRMYRAP
jgi:hypothetical protein